MRSNRFSWVGTVCVASLCVVALSTVNKTVGLRSLSEDEQAAAMGGACVQPAFSCSQNDYCMNVGAGSVYYKFTHMFSGRDDTRMDLECVKRFQYFSNNCPQNQGNVQIASWYACS